MIIIALFAFVTLILPITGVWPPVLKNRDGAHNNAIRITMTPPERNPHESWRGILAQEVVEYWLAWAGALLLSIPACLILLEAGLPFYFTPLVIFICYLWRFPGMKQLEYIGHAAEVVVAGEDGFDLEAYLHAEAARMRHPAAYKGVFTPDDRLADKLRLRFGIARFLVKLLKRRIG